MTTLRRLGSLILILCLLGTADAQLFRRWGGGGCNCSMCQTLAAAGYSKGNSRAHWQTYNALRSGQLNVASAPRRFQSPSYEVVSGGTVSGGSYGSPPAAPVTNDAAIAPCDMATVQEVIRLAGIRPTDVVAEIGTGRDARMSVAAVQAGAGKVYSLEILSDIAEQARRAIARQGLDDVITVITGDAKDATINYDIAVFFLDPVTTEELAPILKQKARTVVSAHHPFDGAIQYGNVWLWERYTADHVD